MSYPPPGPPPGYGPAPYGGPPPGYGGYGYGPVPQEHPQGTIVLVLGILGLVACQLLGPVAWVMGNNALKEIDADPGRYSNRGNVNAGRICGIVATVLIVAIVGIYGLFFVVILGAGFASDSS